MVRGYAVLAACTAAASGLWLTNSRPHSPTPPARPEVDQGCFVGYLQPIQDMRVLCP